MLCLKLNMPSQLFHICDDKLQYVTIHEQQTSFNVMAFD